MRDNCVGFGLGREDRAGPTLAVDRHQVAEANSSLICLCVEGSHEVLVEDE